MKHEEKRPNILNTILDVRLEYDFISISPEIFLFAFTCEGVSHIAVALLTITRHSLLFASQFLMQSLHMLVARSPTCFECLRKIFRFRVGEIGEEHPRAHTLRASS